MISVYCAATSYFKCMLSECVRTLSVPGTLENLHENLNFTHTCPMF